MKRMAGLALVCLVMSVLPATGASAAADKTGVVSPGTPFTWDGTRKLGANPYYFGGAGPTPTTAGPFTKFTCSAEPYQTCETVLLEFRNPLTQAEIDAGVVEKFATVSVRIDQFDPAPSDFDMGFFASDATGTKGPWFGGTQSNSTSGNNPGEAESQTFDIVTTAQQPSVYMLVEVVYFAAPNATFKGSATM
jgi:hypothetical protein